MIKFKKTSSSPPVFIYFTVHYDDKGGDMNTYPAEFENQVYMVAYGVEGLSDHVDSEVYDAHQAFEIDKTKMKMLVPLNMNNQNILNYDLKFGNLFKVIKCYAKPTAKPLPQPSPYDNISILTKKSDNQVVSFSMGVILHSISLFNFYDFDNNPFIDISGRGIRDDRKI